MTEERKVIPIDAESALPEFGADGFFEVVEYTDMRATIKCFIPCNELGEPDPLKFPKFISFIDIAFRGMPQEVPFEIEARTLGEAQANWKAAALKAAGAHIEKCEAEATRLHLLHPGQATPIPPFLKTRH